MATSDDREDPNEKGAKGTHASSETSKAIEPMSWELDPLYHANNYIGDTPSEIHPGTFGLDYYTLQAMSRVPVIGAIINTRIQQIAEFAVPQASPYSTGFKVRLRDGKKSPTKAERDMCESIERMILDAGGQYGPGSFEAFVRCIMRDSLIYDQAAFEILRTRTGKVVGFVPVDAATIRRAKPDPKSAAHGRRQYRDSTRYVQRIQEKIVTEYDYEDLAWCIRRPRTWIWANGYGFPELEELMKVITDLSNAQTWNSVNFTNGIHTSSIISVKSNMNAETFRAFKRNIVAMLSGIRNAKRTPIIQLDPNEKEEIQSVNLSQSNRDMEYMQFVGFLMKLTCAIYSMDAAELGFVFGAENVSSALSTGGPADRIVASKERGLRPILRSLQQWLNTWFVHQVNEDFMIEFVGYDSMTEAQKLELDSKAVRNYKTVNEIRAEHDLRPLDTPVADLILDPTFIQNVMAQQAQQEGPEQPEMDDFEDGMEPDEDMVADDAMSAREFDGETVPFSASGDLDLDDIDFGGLDVSALMRGVASEPTLEKSTAHPGKKAVVVEVI